MGKANSLVDSPSLISTLSLAQMGSASRLESCTVTRIRRLSSLARTDQQSSRSLQNQQASSITMLYVINNIMILYRGINNYIVQLVLEKDFTANNCIINDDYCRT